ncbi:MAG TPA: DEAD/DEAH box helicase [Candidatus Sulfotelmatobacter sp.]|nr:DEAD/DEAH box helicase [Candidatus Sulfotelmatobacter sp.]
MSLNLSTLLAPQFSKNVRHRGEEYYWRDQVRIERASETQFHARVRGSQTYDVELNFRDGMLSVWCDCPYFVDNGVPCKHLWATILAAEAQGGLSWATSAPQLVLSDDSELPFDEADLKTLRARWRDSVSRSRVPVTTRQRALKPPSWQQQFNEIVAPGSRPAAPESTWPAKREVLYIVDISRCLSDGGLCLTLESRDRKKDGSWTRSKPLAMKRSQIQRLPVTEDQQVLSMLAGTQTHAYGYLNPYERLPELSMLPPALSAMLMPLMLRTGRCYLRPQNEPEALLPLAWDDGEAWSFGLELGKAEDGQCALTGFFHRGEERMKLTVPVLVAPGLLLTTDRVARCAQEASFGWISALRKKCSIVAPESEKDQFLAALLCSRNLPPLTVPEEMRYEELASIPAPRLKISQAPTRLGPGRLQADLSFAYDDRIVPEFDSSRGVFDAAGRRFLRRDFDAEAAANTLLDQLGVKRGQPSYWEPEPARGFAASKLPRIVRSLVEAGWHIDAEGKIFRRPGSYRLEVSSGVDWFELHGEVDYGNTKARLPELLAALRRGNNMVQLDDGTYGMLPEEWLRRIGPLAGMGSPENGHIHFTRSQAGLLDALLATQPEAQWDQTFARVRGELHQLGAVENTAQPEGFAGRLRDYQCEGLAWMLFLQRFSFGGCLADDMGVGKTAQVLALLEMRRALRCIGQPIAPSLVVVPKSLVFNWKEEAGRFTPQLRILDHTGMARDGNDFAACDVILTTYGTLRRDILSLKDLEFDYVILDEAQAVKNADTESSKAVRLLRGRYRLALSGTPVENHLGELWSLFEFLNPGMLGAASVFKVAGSTWRNPTEDTRRLLAQALRPLILRRTKQEVAQELPPKSEQTIYCEMETAQRNLYDELRQHYRESLLKRIETDGLTKSKIQVLEALLRLRQVACHPALLDPKRIGDPSAKLEALLAQLREVLDEGHKALVFSQFTSLLKIVGERLNESGVVYEYLDGATRDRQARVERFQDDPSCRIFLISLKAGGVGLNLTAAEYVFILDPWWNPAVEAQAVDRTHRIGQQRPVFAYRLITRYTVEEKILELQNSKRDLAAEIIGAESRVIRNLKPEDLELLLS